MRRDPYPRRFLDTRRYLLAEQLRVFPITILPGK